MVKNAPHKHQDSDKSQNPTVFELLAPLVTLLAEQAAEQYFNDAAQQSEQEIPAKEGPKP